MYTETAYPVINLAETGRRIERQRRQAGLTVRDLQTYFGFEYPQAIYKWQHGECLPTVDNLLALARLLQVSMEDLLVYDDQGVVPFFSLIFLNQRFNDRHPYPCYPLRVDRRRPRRPKGAEQDLRQSRDRQERSVFLKEVRQRTDFG
ncbi:MAG: helix-turn-helix transcriptional regulator [Clostridia bacterium]|nr:helix-turn-helix transcriptional regulator [Clostridia bacterium]